MTTRPATPEQRRSPASGHSLSALRRLALAAGFALLLAAPPAFAAEPLPSIGPYSGQPFVTVQEFAPGATAVRADFEARIIPEASAARLQYVDAAGYDEAAPDPYAAGATLALRQKAEGNPGESPEMHPWQAQLTLAPATTYYYRVVAENAEGQTAETSRRAIQTYPAARHALPDARAYEQVTPPDKNHLDAYGFSTANSSVDQFNMQASPSGSAFAYFSLEPFPLAPATSGKDVFYVSSRSLLPPAWSTQGVQAPTDPNNGNGADEVQAFSADLTRTVLLITGPPLAPPGIVDAYLRDNATGDLQLLASDIGPGFEFVSASTDHSRVFFQDGAQLLPAAAPGVLNLYEWDESRPESERLSLVGLLPASQGGEAPSGGSVAGPTQTVQPANSHQPLRQDAVSADGSRAFFTALPSDRLYERLTAAGQTVPVSPGPAHFLAATPSGHYAFYSEGSELYRFDAESQSRQALTAGAEAIAAFYGASADGAAAFFAAPGVLAENPGSFATGEGDLQGGSSLVTALTTSAGAFLVGQAVFGEGIPPHTTIAAVSPTGLQLSKPATESIAATALTAEGGAVKGAFNVYRWHQGATDFLPVGHPGQTRLNPAATALLYEGGGVLGTGIYLDDPEAPFSSTNPACVSCAPSAAPGDEPGAANLGSTGDEAGIFEGSTLSPSLTRNLSATGDRVFFETAESLLPADVDGRRDVYEWERPGTGSCSPSAAAFLPTTAGCLYLISTGTSHDVSFFGGASESGDDAFFFTRQPLVGSDTDLNLDVYDARVGGGIAAQNPSPPPPPCEAEEACRPHAAEPPTESSSATEHFESREPPPRCSRGFVRKHGRCVKRHRRQSHGRANRGRGGNR